MTRRLKISKWGARSVAGLLLACVAPLFAAELDPALEAQMRNDSARYRLPVLLFMRDSLALPSADSAIKKSSGQLLVELKAHAEQSQRSVVRQMSVFGSPYAKPLVLVNAVAASLSVAQIENLLQRDDIERIEADPVIHAAASRAPATCRSGVAAPKRQRIVPCEYADAIAPVNGGLVQDTNAVLSKQVANMQVQTLWQQSNFGEKAVLAIVDTGVDLANPELSRNFRGGKGDWFDVHGEHKSPTDRHGHGTRVSSVMFGKHGSREAIGVAPRAKWIAAKVFNAEHRGRLSDVYQAWAWLLDPDGNPSTDDAPDVVLNAWGLPGMRAACNSKHAQSLAWLRLANIHMVFPLSLPDAGSQLALWPAADKNSFVVGGEGQGKSSFSVVNSCRERETPDVQVQSIGIKVSDIAAGPLTSYGNVDGVSYAAALAAAKLALIKVSRPAMNFEQRERAMRSEE